MREQQSAMVKALVELREESKCFQQSDEVDLLKNKVQALEAMHFRLLEHLSQRNVSQGRRGLSILLVEDQVAVRNLWTRLISSSLEGCTVAQASHGLEAVQMCEVDTYDVRTRANTGGCTLFFNLIPPRALTKA